MADYPDYTQLFNLVGSDIMVPIDIQGSDIMLPIDIQAQYVTLEIDIVAQTVGNIAIDLAAQSIGNIAVDISAQTISNLIIDINAQSVGLYLQPEWAALRGTGKDFHVSASQRSFSGYAQNTYTVPNGKTLFITGVQAYCHSFLDEDGDKPQHFDADVYRNGTLVCAFGGDGGLSVNLTKPIAFTAGTVFLYRIYCRAYHDCDIGINAQGYEV